MSGTDRETRIRILRVSARLFAARGFEKVTVREICRKAEANVAAVNYHFGDKLGLYREVLDKAIETMRATTDSARAGGEGHAPEQRLRTYIRVFLQRVAGQGHDVWIHQLMQHEMADPTPALDLVIEQVLRPRMAYLGQLIAEMLGRPEDDEDVRRSVLSVQAQCHAMAAHPFWRRVTPNVHPGPAEVDALAAHIAEFSLGGIGALHAVADAAR